MQTQTYKPFSIKDCHLLQLVNILLYITLAACNAMNRNLPEEEHVSAAMLPNIVDG